MKKTGLPVPASDNPIVAQVYLITLVASFKA